MQLKNKRILIISPHHWGKIKISKHHYAVELFLKGNQVFFLNPPDISVKGLEIHIDEGVHVVSYHPLFRGERFLPSWTTAYLKKKTAQKITRATGPLDIVWNFDPVSYPNLSVFNARVKIFHPVDLIRDKHANVHKSADIIFCVTETDRGYLETGKAPVHFIAHGLNRDFEHMAREILDQPMANHNNKVTVGFIGSLFKESLDRNALRKVISAHPEIDFLFIGPYERKNVNISGYYEQPVFEFIDFLKQQSHVRLAGALPPKEMIGLMKQVDAWINCELTGVANLWDGSNSHKLIEYLSTGKVVISTFVSTYKNKAQLFSMLPDHGSDYCNLFDLTIGQLGRFNSKERIRERIGFALDNTYARQLDRIEKHLADL